MPVERVDGLRATVSRGGVQSRLLETASAKWRSGARESGSCWWEAPEADNGLSGTSQIDALPACPSSFGRTTGSTLLSTWWLGTTSAHPNCVFPWPAAAFAFVVLVFLGLGSVSPLARSAFFARGFRGLPDLVSFGASAVAAATVRSLATVCGSALSKKGDRVLRGSRSSGSRVFLLSASLSPLVLRALGFGFGFATSVAAAFLAAAARFVVFFAGTPTPTPTGPPSSAASREAVRRRPCCISVTCSIGCCAKCSERTRLPTVANPLVAFSGMGTAREPEVKAPPRCFLGLEGGERANGEDGGIATRLVAATEPEGGGGELHTSTSTSGAGAGGDEESTTMVYSFAAICSSCTCRLRASVRLPRQEPSTASALDGPRYRYRGGENAAVTPP